MNPQPHHQSLTMPPALKLSTVPSSSTRRNWSYVGANANSKSYAPLSNLISYTVINSTRFGHSCHPNGTHSANATESHPDSVHDLDPTAGLCPSARNELCDASTATCRCIDGHSFDAELAHCQPHGRITMSGVLFYGLVAVAVGLLARWLNLRWRERRQQRARLLEELSGDAEATVYQRPMTTAKQMSVVDLTADERTKQYDFYRREREREQREELAAVEAAAAKAATNGAFSI